MVNTGLNNASLVRILYIQVLCTFDTSYYCLVCSDFVDSDLSHNCASCPACTASDKQQFELLPTHVQGISKVYFSKLYLGLKSHVICIACD
jgi:hypothetical protein